MRSPLGQILSQRSNTENLEDIASDIMQKENKYSNQESYVRNKSVIINTS